MTEIERLLTAAELESQTPEGARELAAAEIMVRASTLVTKAFEQSGMSQKDLADTLGVSEGRVSQVLRGDGNMRLSTLARYLRATGFLARLDAVPAAASIAPLRSRTPRRARRRNNADPHDIYVTQLDHEGKPAFKLTFVPHGVPVDATETSPTNPVGITHARLAWSPIATKEVASQ